jgi:hypothetical protein
VENKGRVALPPRDHANALVAYWSRSVVLRGGYEQLVAVWSYVKRVANVGDDRAYVTEYALHMFLLTAWEP